MHSYWDFRNFRLELINKVLAHMQPISLLYSQEERDKEDGFQNSSRDQGKSSQYKHLYAVSYSYIDFRHLIFGLKLRQTYDDSNEEVLEYLAEVERRQADRKEIGKIEMAKRKHR